MTYPLLAPLAQLAEQLTLNQGALLENAEEFGISHKSAAPGAALGAEDGDATGRVSGQGTATAALDDAELAEVLDRWATLPEAIRRAVMALVRTSG